MSSQEDIRASIKEKIRQRIREKELELQGGSSNARKGESDEGDSRSGSVRGGNATGDDGRRSPDSDAVRDRIRERIRQKMMEKMGPEHGAESSNDRRTPKREETQSASSSKRTPYGNAANEGSARGARSTLRQGLFSDDDDDSDEDFLLAIRQRVSRPSASDKKPTAATNSSSDERGGSSRPGSRISDGYESGGSTSNNDRPVRSRAEPIRESPERERSSWFTRTEDSSRGPSPVSSFRDELIAPSLTASQLNQLHQRQPPQPEPMIESERDIGVDQLIAELDFDKGVHLYHVYTDAPSLKHLCPIVATAIVGDKLFGTYKSGDAELVPPPVPLSSITRVVKLNRQLSLSAFRSQPTPHPPAPPMRTSAPTDEYSPPRRVQSVAPTAAPPTQRNEFRLSQGPVAEYAILDPLDDLLRRCAIPGPNQGLAVADLAEQAQNANSQVPLASKGAVNILEDLIHLTDADLVSNGCRALAYLARNDSVELKIAQTGGILARLVDLLTASEVDVVLQAAVALGNLTVNPQNKVSVGSSDAALKNIVSLLSSSNNAILKAACRIIANLTLNTNNQERLADKGALAPLISILDIPSPDLQRQAAMALGNLSVNDVNEVSIVNLHGVRPLVSLLKSVNVEIHRQALRVLVNLSVPRENKRRMIEEGALQPIMQATRSPSEQVRRHAVRALTNLSRDELNQEVVVAHGGAQLCLELLEAHKGNDEIQSGALTTLGLLASNSTNLKFLRNEIDPLLIRPYTAATDEETARAAALLLEYLNHGPPVKDALDVAIEQLKSNDNYQVQAAVETLRDIDLAAGSEFRQRLLINGGVKMLLPILSSPDWIIRSTACYVLCKLAVEPDGLDALQGLLSGFSDAERMATVAQTSRVGGPGGTSETNKMLQMQMEIANLRNTNEQMKKEIEQRRLGRTDGTAENIRRRAAIGNARNNVKRSIAALRRPLSEIKGDLNSYGGWFSRSVSSISSATARFEGATSAMSRRYQALNFERKNLYNKLQEARGNIRVFCRVRGLTREEQRRGEETIVNCHPSDGSVSIPVIDRPSAAPKRFVFDDVFGPSASQEEVSRSAVPLVVSVLDGYNVCIMAYGQTGSGKTYTMEGPTHDRGISYRTLRDLFQIAAEKEAAGEMKFVFVVSLLEIYNEQVCDLLSPGTDSARLNIKRDTRGTSIPGLKEVRVVSLSEVASVLDEGHRNRSTRATDVNSHSSRSHAIFQIVVHGSNMITGERSVGKLLLVDLAGSERIKQSNAYGEGLTEAKHINRSLSSLGDVIAARLSRSPHVPYRNSKLTFFLQDVFEGDGKVLLYVQVSPTHTNGGESMSTLTFAGRVRNVELGPAKRHVLLDNYSEI